MKTIKQKILPQLFIIYTRYLIGGAFVFASLVKVQGLRFTAESGADNPIASAWHFFETMYQSGLYWKFIGVSQLLAGFLLLTQKYSKLGALMNLPVIANIFVITLSYYFAFTPVITGLMLAANLLLLVWEWNELKLLFNLTPTLDTDDRLEKDILWQLTGFLLFVCIVLCKFTLSEATVLLWLPTFFLIGSASLFLGLRRERKRKQALPH